jgi:hypothetical protein
MATFRDARPSIEPQSRPRPRPTVTPTPAPRGRPTLDDPESQDPSQPFNLNLDDLMRDPGLLDRMLKAREPYMPKGPVQPGGTPAPSPTPLGGLEQGGMNVAAGTPEDDQRMQEIMQEIGPMMDGGTPTLTPTPRAPTPAPTRAPNPLLQAPPAPVKRKNLLDKMLGR